MFIIRNIKLFCLWMSYKLSEMRNVYSHKAVSHQTDKNGETTIIYTILGKRDLYRILLEDLMGNKELLERFHPCQAAKFGAVSMGDVLFSFPAEQREKRYDKIKSQMLGADENESHQRQSVG